MSVREYAMGLEKLEKFEIIPVSVSIWLGNLSLKWDHRDPVDRTIVALAQLMDCPLVTSDKNIAVFYRETIW